MTVPSTIRKAGPYNGNDVATAFAFSFKVFTSADIAVTVADVDGTETLLVLDSDYSVTLNGDQDASPGGSITYPLSGTPLATGEALVIVGDLDYGQDLDVPTGGDFNPAALEDALDKQAMRTQQLLEINGRSMTLAVTSDAGVSTSLPSPVAGRFIGWNATADALINYAGTTGVAVSSFMEGVVAAATGALARAALGITAIGDALATAASAAAARTTLSVAPRATRIDVASVAGTVNLTTAAPDTDDIQITGNLAITAFTVAVGRVIRVVVSGTPTLANNANIDTQTGATITCAAGDTFLLRATAANVVEVLNYTRAGSNGLTFSGGNTTVSGTLTATGKATFSAGFGAGNVNQSCVRVYTANGFGSTNTKIRRFTTTALSQGTDITYADSATLGASFTINAAGMYAVTYSDSGTAATQIGLSLNTSTPTTAVGAISAAQRLTGGTTTAANGYFGSAVWTGYLAAGDVVRPHSDGVAVGATDNTTFTIARVS